MTSVSQINWMDIYLKYTHYYIVKNVKLMLIFTCIMQKILPNGFSPSSFSLLNCLYNQKKKKKTPY